MIRAKDFLLGVLIAVLGASLPAFASDDQSPRTQPPPPRPAPPSRPTWRSSGFLSLDGGVQATALSFTDNHRESLGGEESTWQAGYKLKNGIQYDVAGGGRVWRNLVAAVGYSYFEDNRRASISGQVPHPFFFDRPRNISGESAALKHQEHAVHVSALWMIPASRRLEIGVFGGPSFFIVKRSFIEEVKYDETYPYDAATFSSATARELSKNQLGAHGGVDVTWLLTQQVGIGALLRFSRARIDFSTPAGGSVSLNVGGPQAGLGLRIRMGGRRPPGVPRAPTNTTPPLSPSELVAKETSAITTTSTPVFIRPDAARTPLKILAPDTRLTVLEKSREWLRVEFYDPQWGRRVGYVQRKNVREIK